MSRISQKPENTLKRADDLIAVNQHSAALDLLLDAIMSKRSRTTVLASLDSIMVRFIDLAVMLRKGKIAKEGLHQYKNIAQNVTVSVIDVVITRFIELSEQKVTEAQLKADQINLDNVEDLEAMETPESILLSTVSGAVSKDRTDRLVVTPWLKFLWEAYRTALDILRNNSRLEVLYQTVASQAFKFCLKYTRKTEFRRLCEILRLHLSTTAKYAHQPHAINLNEPETLQRHLDTRFEQLNSAAELELWQEGFRSIEDIFSLMAVSKKPPKLFMLANYYQKLAKLFLCGENYLFHAAAWSKYYSIAKLNKSITGEERDRIATNVLLSALAVPILAPAKTCSSLNDSEDLAAKSLHLASLLGSDIPTRESVLNDALNPSVYAHVKPEFKHLYNLIEVEFNPLKLPSKTTPLLKLMLDQKDLSKYAKPIHSVILTRLFGHLSVVYDEMKIDNIVKLVAFPGTGFEKSERMVEIILLNQCRRGDLHVSIDHLSRTVRFNRNFFASGLSQNDSMSNVSLSNDCRKLIVDFAKKLESVAVAMDGEKMKKQSEDEITKQALRKIAELKSEASVRKRIIENTKLEKEQEAAQKIRDEEKARLLNEKKEAEAEKLRLETEAKKREAEKIQQLNETREKEEVKKLTEQILSEMGGKVKEEDLASLDSTALRAKQIQLLEQEKNEIATKTRLIAKRLDHMERAMRKNESPKWEEKFVEQRRIDKAYHEGLQEAALEAAQLTHAKHLKLKQRFEKMLPDFENYTSQLREIRDEKFRVLKAESEKNIADAKAERILKLKQQKLDDMIKKQKEEEERLRKAEEERLRLLEEERIAAEKAAQLAIKKAEEAERKKKLDEQYAIQLERQRIAEEKLNQKNQVYRQDKKSSLATPTENDTWRRKEDGTSVPGAAPVTATGKYRPKAWTGPAKKTQEDSSTPAPATPKGDSTEKKEVFRPKVGEWRKPESKPQSEAFSSFNNDRKRSDKDLFSSRNQSNTSSDSKGAEKGKFNNSGLDKESSSKDSEVNDWKKVEGKAPASQGKYIPPGKRYK